MTKSPARRTRESVQEKQARLHPFMPNPGHPDLCAACNAGRDDLRRGTRIHER